MKSPQKVLDIGCGSGIFSFYLAQKGHKVIGIDGAEEMIKLCQTQLANNPILNLHFEKKQLPLTTIISEPQDAIIASSVLEYVKPLEETITSLKKHLKKEGFFIFSLPNNQAVYRKIEKIFFRITGKPAYLNYVHHSPSIRKIKDQLAKKDFQYISHQYFAGNNFLSKILRKVLPSKYATNLVVIVFRYNP